MGQGKGGAEVSRKADNAGKEEHKCCEAESAGYILCMSGNLSLNHLALRQVHTCLTLSRDL
jgi:hypothetical protein